MAALPKKHYGLILKKNKPRLPILPVQSTAAAAFANSDDDDAVDTQVLSSASTSASTMRIRMQAKRDHERALAQDPSIFEYDAIYDDLQANKNQKIAQQKAADKEHKSKYAEQIIKAHKRRLLEQQSREERRQMKEREAEAGEFDDKEVFVTGAYRKQMEEMQKFREQEAVENRLDELTAVEKQKGGVWQGGFYRTLLNDLAREDTSISDGGNKEIKKEMVLNEGDQQPSVSSKQLSNKLKSLRRPSDSWDDQLIVGISEGKQKADVECSSNSATKEEEMKKLKNKSIYSDDSEQDEPSECSDQPILKPGLNILSKSVKKPTKAEQFQSRFTPSPCHSDAVNSNSENEQQTQREIKERRKKGGEERYKGRTSDNHSCGTNERDRSNDHCRSHKRDRKRDERESRNREREPLYKKDKREQRKEDKNMKDGNMAAGVKNSAKPATREERLKVLKELLKQRNTEEDIVEFRRRYLERKESGVVTVPI